ncbi:MAG TPA: metalloregulator ArsR/SmtB family transcription factor [Ignavibacteriaceae bacterium]|nr:metalloregulator ArsR/SmtB family transcription factor [Ignavibacteriaceae bacterium]
MSEILTAISHPNRIRILKALQKDTMLCGCEILPLLDLEQSNLSRHLSTLVKAGVLIAWKDGVRMNYKIADERIYNLINMAEQIANEKSRLNNSVPA